MSIKSRVSGKYYDLSNIDDVDRLSGLIDDAQINKAKSIAFQLMREICSIHASQHREVGVCEWVKDYEYLNVYKSKCTNNMWNFDEENYCPECGNKIKLVESE